MARRPNEAGARNGATPPPTLLSGFSDDASTRLSATPLGVGAHVGLWIKINAGIPSFRHRTHLARLIVQYPYILYVQYTSSVSRAPTVATSTVQYSSTSLLSRPITRSPRHGDGAERCLRPRHSSPTKSSRGMPARLRCPAAQHSK